MGDPQISRTDVPLALCSEGSLAKLDPRDQMIRGPGRVARDGAGDPQRRASLAVGKNF